MPDIPDVKTEVQVVWELLDEDGRTWSQSDAPTAEEAIAQTREQLARMVELEADMEARHGEGVPDGKRVRDVKLAKVRRRTSIQVTAYSTTYSDEQAITEAADA
ncbi:hypothetical protein [Nocardia nova]|uniref:hypothetical protein n=1 Tax=Nocardia nova TaxID=37330 RepID=UPI002739F769|nr:hypothetical protein [Nocardia nova]